MAHMQIRQRVRDLLALAAGGHRARLSQRPQVLRHQVQCDHVDGKGSQSEERGERRKRGWAMTKIATTAMIAAATMSGRGAQTP